MNRVTKHQYIRVMPYNRDAVKDFHLNTSIAVGNNQFFGHYDVQANEIVVVRYVQMRIQSTSANQVVLRFAMSRNGQLSRVPWLVSGDTGSSFPAINTPMETVLHEGDYMEFIANVSTSAVICVMGYLADIIYI